MAAQNKRERSGPPFYACSRLGAQELIMKLSNDSFALLLLCSHLGLPDEPDAKPLSTREWNQLEEKLRAQNVEVGDLTGASAEKVDSILQTTGAEAARVVWLLERGGP